MTTATIESTSLSTSAISFVCQVVRDKSAIELDPSKSYMIEARLAPVAKQNGFATTTKFIADVMANHRPQLVAQIVEAMTTNETSFFRDSSPFEVLRTEVLPELRDLNAAQQTLNIWSAACSTGQELYSIAMLLRENFPEMTSWKVDLRGTDLSDEVLDRAREARFSQVEIKRGLEASLLEKYFERERDGKKWQLCPSLRAMATFSKLNLIDYWPPMPLMDVVFLRNVLIYFSPESKKTILKKVREVMHPHGVLFLGAAETTMNLDSEFERVQVGKGVFYRIK